MIVLKKIARFILRQFWWHFCSNLRYSGWIRRRANELWGFVSDGKRYQAVLKFCDRVELILFYIFYYEKISYPWRICCCFDWLQNPWLLLKLSLKLKKMIIQCFWKLSTSSRRFSRSSSDFSRWRSLSSQIFNSSSVFLLFEGLLSRGLIGEGLSGMRLT